MPAFRIDALHENVPVEFRRFVGVWASKVGFGNGAGRHAMLIITSISVEGNVNGYVMWGPPTKDSFFQTPAGYRRFTARIINDRFEFENGSVLSTATFLPTNAVRIRDDYKDGKNATVQVEPIWIMSGR